eukprot:TRINITY_DN4788_c2_g1_i1.p1 TRINITY_DN4788_c2_g1~~TRINITY_DN4788_c2_g1_i1.p1  ORF type:complete len:293 (-),score=96.83 TRINITY_DN4788_c2_g1_i1:53-931(-)
MQKNEELDLIKFPRTRHLFDAGGSAVGRDDLLMDAEDSKIWFKNAMVSIEEKIDGSNLGISITPDYKLRFQNRSHFVNIETAQQWKQLDQWVSTHPGVYELLCAYPHYILYGEWCYAKHSILYDNLPDLFLAFDIWDKNAEKFLSRLERDKVLEGKGISTVPLVKYGRLGKEEYKELLETKSKFREEGFVEGIYVRIDEEENEHLKGVYEKKRIEEEKLAARSKGKGGGKGKAAVSKGKGGNNNKSGGDGEEKKHYLMDRSKVVRSDFTPVEDPDVVHWSRQQLTKNIVTYQ